MNQETIAKITPFLQMDMWSHFDTFPLLAGYIRIERSVFLDTRTGNKIAAEIESLAEYSTAIERIKQVKNIWQQSLHDPRIVRHPEEDRYFDYQKDYCINWATTHKIDVPWLGWAIKNKFVTLDANNSDPLGEEKDKSLPKTLVSEVVYLNIIGVLTAHLVQKELKRSFTSQNQLVDTLVEEFASSRNGISKATLHKVFSKANDAYEAIVKKE